MEVKCQYDIPAVLARWTSTLAARRTLQPLYTTAAPKKTTVTENFSMEIEAKMFNIMRLPYNLWVQNKLTINKFHVLKTEKNSYEFCLLSVAKFTQYQLILPEH